MDMHSVHWYQLRTREKCEKCGWPVRIIASIEDPDVIQKIQKHLGLDQPDDPQNRSPPVGLHDQPTTLFWFQPRRIRVSVSVAPGLGWNPTAALMRCRSNKGQLTSHEGTVSTIGVSRYISERVRMFYQATRGKGW